jgi:hypothetical protein
MDLPSGNDNSEGTARGDDSYEEIRGKRKTDIPNAIGYADREVVEIAGESQHDDQEDIQWSRPGEKDCRSCRRGGA